jgi:acetyl esterase/lipase
VALLVAAAVAGVLLLGRGSGEEDALRAACAASPGAGPADVGGPVRSASGRPSGALASPGGLSSATGRTAGALGPLPAGYELRAPAGRPRGVALVVHGGAWRGVGPLEVARMRPEAERWVHRGWATANVDYRPCRRSLGDVLAAYDAIRRRAGPRTPIVAVGDSAGGQLALLVAARRPGVAAVVARAAPTDPAGVARERTWNPRLGRPSVAFPRVLAHLWQTALGPGWTTTWAPVRQAAATRAPVLLAGAVRDPLVPPAQARTMAAALDAAHPSRTTPVLRLAPGPVRFPHARVAVRDDRRLQAAIDRLVAPFARGPARTPPVVPGWWPAARTLPAPTRGTDRSAS